MSSKRFCVFLLVCLALTILRSLTTCPGSWRTFVLSVPEIPLSLNKPLEGQTLSSKNKHNEAANVTKKVSSRLDFVSNLNGTIGSPPPPPQWCNSCLNYHQYKALIYPKHIPDTYLDMVVFIPSQQRDDSFQRRQFLRKEVLNSTFFPQVKFRHVFVFGTCKDCNQTKLQEEAQLYDDIVVFDFLDTYMNLTIKTIVSLNWVFNTYNTDMFLKLDSDVLLNVTDVHHTVLRYLHNKTDDFGNSILGFCFSHNAHPIRDLQNKWGISKEAYPNPTYPRYCIGPSYALTRSTVSLLLSQTHNTPLIHLEDVSVGILAQKAGNIKLIDVPNWMVLWNWMDDNPEKYREYHTIHTDQGRIEEVKELWNNIYNFPN